MVKLHWANVVGILLILCAGLPVRAQAAPSESVVASFSLPNGEYKVPLPDGFCVATGKYDAAAKIAAAADSTNLTDISLYPCADMAAGKDPTFWGMIKTPLETLKEKAPPRSELLEELKSQTDPAALKQLNEEASKEATQQAQRVIGNGERIGMDAKAVDLDSVGIYYAGTVTMGNGSSATDTYSIAYSVTSAAGNIFCIYIYGPHNGANDVLDVLAKVKKETSDFVSANGG